jgi:hypothetical protein
VREWVLYQGRALRVRPFVFAARVLFVADWRALGTSIPGLVGNWCHPQIMERIYPEGSSSAHRRNGLMSPTRQRDKV